MYLMRYPYASMCAEIFMGNPLPVCQLEVFSQETKSECPRKR